MTDQSTAAPNPGSANPAGGDWRAAFGAEATETLKSFETPGAFLKSWQDTTAEAKTLREKPGTDWRKDLSGGDEKAFKTFERFSTPADAGKAYLEAVNKIRSGELAKPIAKDATAEQIAEWRKANGIPEKAEGYFEKLPNGRVIGQADQPLFTKFANDIAHKHNIPPAAVHDIVEWYYKLGDDETAQIAETDKSHQRESEDALRKAWGDDFRANSNHLENYLTGLPEGLQKAFREGFGADGRKLVHNPDFVQWMANIAREFNPAGMVSAGGNESQMTNIEDEIGKLVKLSAEKPKDYWGTKNEARHKQLIEARQKLQSRMRA